jgi:hypothetical protein
VGAVLVVTWLVGCGGSHGLDGGVDDDVPAMDAPIEDDTPSPAEDVREAGVDADSCEGYEQGYTICPGDTRMCCGGTWWHFVDGPCLPGIDAGGTGDAGGPCAIDPHAAGCPCDVEGDVYCTVSSWRMECTGGVWTNRLHIACCMGETTD